MTIQEFPLSNRPKSGLKPWYISLAISHLSFLAPTTALLLPPSITMKLAVEVLDAAGLAAKDPSGFSNPFVQVDFDGQLQRTAPKLRDLSPSWNETLVFDIDDASRLASLTVDVLVFHDAGAGHRSKCLGKVRITAASIAASPDAAAAVRFPLEKRGLFTRVSGDIALKVYLLPVTAADAAAAAAATGWDQDAAMKEPDAPPPPSKKENSEQKKFVTNDGGGRPPARVFHAVGGDMKKSNAPAPPPGTAVLVPMPPAPGGPIPARPELGLIETRPPLAARLGARATPASKIASTYDLVEPMPYLYVHVVKARDLPAMDVAGSLDPYVEAKLGNFRGRTAHREKTQHPYFNQIFAFSREHLQASALEVSVKDKDLLKDDFVGRVVFDMNEVPQRVPPDSPLAPQWYRLADRRGDKLLHGEVMLAVWIGTQADEAFSEAWHSDAHSLPPQALPLTRSKVYFSPKLVYVRVAVLSAQDLVPAEKGRPVSAAVKVQLGQQLRRTRPAAAGAVNPAWGEEFMVVAAEPFEEPLVITVEDRVAPGKDVALGTVYIPVAALPRNDHGKLVETRWFSLARPAATAAEGDAAATEKEEKETTRFSSKIHLRASLETGYHVLDEATHYSSDFQPAAKALRKAPIGLLELGILGARGLLPMKAKDGRATDAYCVAKYGPKWVRTRTLLDTVSPQWHEQYTWEVFDPCTVLTVVVVDNCLAGAASGGADQRIGKVRIRLSTLETDRVYTHLYPLLVLQPSGLKKTGELHLAVRFTCVHLVNMLALYGRPLLPKAHYASPVALPQMDYLRHQAMQMVAARLARAEPPLRREVVEYTLDVDVHMFSLRRSKANFFRLTALFSGMMAVAKWLDAICYWRSPATTALVHVLFFILVCYPELILSTLFLYLFLIGAWNYRFRPRQPPHMDARLSHAELAIPDELDEEMDAFPTARPADVVRFRYDRLRSVAGRVQTVVGDLATQGERAQALLSWRDPRATAIFIMFAAVSAVVLYVTPVKVILLLAGLYLLRHPRFRSKMPSAPINFYKRLPAKSDTML